MAKNNNSFFDFMSAIIVSLKMQGRIRTSETYQTALNSFKRYRKERDISLRSLNSEIIGAYEAYLRARDLVPNTISFYMRILRAAYNKAVTYGMTPQRDPFRHVYTGVDRTVKRALSLSTLRRLKRMNLSNDPKLDYARDMLLLSFALRGMSFVDMAYLRKTDLRDGYITYKRRKTGCALTIAWTPEMQFILNKYPINATPYLLPIITGVTGEARNQYRRQGYNINRSLRKVACRLGLSSPLTMYVARHSWASVAKSQGIPICVISEGMGHKSETTTRIYLAELDTSIIDRANLRILRALG